VILVILALLWAALLIPMAVRRLRDGGPEKSIEHFHTEHEVLSRQGYAVAPAYRLSEPVRYEAPPEPRRPHLTVVHEGDTYRTLESRSSWEEWSEDYDFEAEERPSRSVRSNRYAAAYSSVPRDAELSARYEPPVTRQRSMRSRRRVVFTRLLLVAVVAAVASFVTGYSLLLDVAVLAWVAVVGYVALALYAVSQGYLLESSLGLARRGRGLATVEPLYGDYERFDEPAGYDDTGYERYPRREVAIDEVDEDDEEYYDPQAGRWRRGSSSHYALG
jgi:hypothetical protein